jgi:cytochrome c biogenesis protein CcmG, thiol:disulfide interchange protein DsbE
VLGAGLTSVLGCSSALATEGNDPPGFNLAAWRGHVIYLDFWASWCGPCIQSFAWMQAMATQFGPQGLKVVAVNLDKQRAAADAFLARHPALGITVVFDPQAVLARRYRVSGMPSSYLIDRDGNTVHAHTGFVPADRAPLQTRIETALALRAVAPPGAK